MKTRSLALPALVLLFTACDNDVPGQDKTTTNSNQQVTSSPDWLVASSQVFDGGPGKDGIPALTDPDMVTSDRVSDYLNDDDLVIGIKRGDDIRAYAHAILDWHEIINDEIGEDHVAITYCPLTGTALGWDRNVGGTITTFGVSGLLFQSNLIPYDRQTDSYYSQIMAIGIHGNQISRRPELHQLVETTWANWKKWYPNTLITSSKTGHSRNYTFYPYGNYKNQNNETLYFPVNNRDKTLPAKERVLGIVGRNQQEVRIFQFDLFDERGLLIELIESREVVIIGDSMDNWMIAFYVPEINGVSSEFQILDDEGPVILADQSGNQWDIFGKAVSGPNIGEQLEIPESFIGYWFAWATFYPSLTIYSGDE